MSEIELLAGVSLCNQTMQPKPYLERGLLEEQGVDMQGRQFSEGYILVSEIQESLP